MIHHQEVAEHIMLGQMEFSNAVAYATANDCSIRIARDGKYYAVLARDYVPTRINVWLNDDDRRVIKAYVG